MYEHQISNGHCDLPEASRVSIGVSVRVRVRVRVRGMMRIRDQREESTTPSKP